MKSAPRVDSRYSLFVRAAPAQSEVWTVGAIFAECRNNFGIFFGSFVTNYDETDFRLRAPAFAKSRPHMFQARAITMHTRVT
jgi:hypothetical protein